MSQSALITTPKSTPRVAPICRIGVRCENVALTQLPFVNGTITFHFVHERLKFGYEHGRPTKTAWEAYQEGTGVCRDFAHLAVTFCRCMNIPARYCTGYLGDIGVPAMDAPMDFSGWFEAYLGGQWHVFDARFNTPRVGRVLMARGRDAADVAIVTTFGPNTLTGFEVTANEIVP